MWVHVDARRARKLSTCSYRGWEHDGLFRFPVAAIFVVLNALEDSLQNLIWPCVGGTKLNYKYTMYQLLNKCITKTITTYFTCLGRSDNQSLGDSSGEQNSLTRPWSAYKPESLYCTGKTVGRVEV